MGFFFIFSGFIFLHGCAGNIDRKSGTHNQKQTIITTKGIKTEIKLIEKGPYRTKLLDESLDAKLLDTIEGHETKDNNIAKICGVRKKPRDEVALPLALLIPLIKPVVKFLIDKINDSLKKELQEYIKNYQTGIQTSTFYDVTGEDPKLKFKCFRFIRKGLNKKTKKDEIQLDLIGQFKIAENKDSLQIRPLRLYFKKAAAKGDTIALSIDINAASFWQQNNFGESSMIFSSPLIGEKITKNKVIYYLDKAWEKYPIHRLIPWSTNRHKLEGGNANITISATETGNLPWLLENGAKLFNKYSDKISEKIVENIQILIPNPK